MSWPLVQIGRYAEKVRTWNPTAGSEGVFRYIDLSSVDKSRKIIDLDSVVEISTVDAPSRARQLVVTGDVLVATVRPNLNGVAVVPTELNGATASTGYCVLRADEKNLHGRYLYYWVQTNYFVEEMLSKATGANYPAVSDKVIKESQIPLPPLPEQKRIAAVLDKVDAIRRKRQYTIELADDFLRAVFLKMFGDPMTNPKGWAIDYLQNMGTFKNGLNYKRDDVGASVRFLGVGDFKSLHRIEGVNTLSEIQLDSLPSEGYLLRNGDLVFVRSNGNGALVGRCVTVYPGDEKLAFSGFCIRFRISSDCIDSEYLGYLFRMPSVRNAMLKGGQGANIQNINQEKLSEIAIPIPPAELQKCFVRLVEAFKDFQVKNNISLDEGHSLFKSISQKAFSGVL